MLDVEIQIPSTLACAPVNDLDANFPQMQPFGLCLAARPASAELEASITPQACPPARDIQLLKVHLALPARTLNVALNVKHCT